MKGGVDKIIDILAALGEIALTWLPLLFFGLICYLLWRSLALMPRVKPTEVEPDSKSSISWDDIAGVDEAAARIRKLFDKARRNEPAIVFIDELDAVGMRRSGSSFNREHDQTLNQLLVELDGFGGSGEVVIIGASNRIEDLDPALLRPGRFDRQVLVAPPDLAGREAILAVHTRGKPLADGVKLEQLARQTAGLTGADLANVCNEAAIFAGRAGRTAIANEDFDDAFER